MTRLEFCWSKLFWALFPRILFINKWKQINPFLLPSLFLWFKFSWDKLWYFFIHPAFLFQSGCDKKKNGCDSLGASTDKTYFHADRPFKIPWSTGEKYRADVRGNRLPFPSKTKNNFSGIDISQPTTSVSLFGKFNIRFQGPMIWNSIDEDFKSSSLSSFKLNLKEHLTNNY